MNEQIKKKKKTPHDVTRMYFSQLEMLCPRILDIDKERKSSVVKYVRLVAHAAGTWLQISSICDSVMALL